MAADFFEGDGQMDIAISEGADEPLVHPEEQMLDLVFQVFDSEGRGKVSVVQIIERLKSVIDPSRDGDKLRCLCEMLDPEDQGILVDLETFRRIMTEWIASCCQDGEFAGKTSSDDESVKEFSQMTPEKLLHNDAQLVGYGGDDKTCLGENADLIGKISELNFANKNLNEEKAKLQRSLELSDEMNSHLTEEVSTLKSKLKSVQQTVQRAQAASNELEDVKMVVRNLEDKVGALCFEKKQLDKENASLNKQVQTLQEENEKFIHEKERAKEEMNELRTAHSRIMCKLCECESLLSEKEELLAQKLMQSEELQLIVEEHVSVIQELKTQKNDLQEQLMQVREDEAIQPDDIVSAVTGPDLVQSVCAEIAEMDTDPNEKRKLSSPLCGITLYSSTQDTPRMHDVNVEADDAGTELLLAHLMQGTDVIMNLLQQVISPERSSPQQSEEQILQSLCQLKNAWKRLSGMLNGALQLYTEKEQSLHPRSGINGDAPDLSLLPLDNKIVPLGRGLLCSTTTNNIADGHIAWFRKVQGCSVGQRCTRVGRNISIPKLLVLLLLSTLFFYPTNPSENIWTAASRLLAPHLCMQHLQPPPF